MLPADGGVTIEGLTPAQIASEKATIFIGDVDGLIEELKEKTS